MTATLANQTARYGRKREEILNAAAGLFNARGLSGASIADIAQAVGLTPTSLTYYYRKKEELAAACMERVVATLHGLLTETEGAPTPEARLASFIRAYFDLLAEIAAERSPDLMNFWDLRGMSGPQGERSVEGFVSLFRRFRQLFRDPAGPSFSHAEQNARGHLVFSAVLYSKQWLRMYEPEDYARAAERFLDLLIGGLGRVEAWSPPRLELHGSPAALGEVSREAFLRAATELVNAQGYREASVDRISAKLSVTKGSFYHHHQNKSDLINQCFERTFEVVRQAHRSASRLESDGWGRLCAAADALARYQLSSEGPLLRYTAVAAVCEEMRPRFLAEFARQAERRAGVVAEAIADGSVRPIDPLIAGRYVTGVIDAAAELTKWCAAATEESAAELYLRPALTGVFHPKA